MASSKWGIAQTCTSHKAYKHLRLLQRRIFQSSPVSTWPTKHAQSVYLSSATACTCVIVFLSSSFPNPVQSTRKDLQRLWPTRKTTSQRTRHSHTTVSWTLAIHAVADTMLISSRRRQRCRCRRPSTTPTADTFGTCYPPHQQSPHKRHVQVKEGSPSRRHSRNLG